MTDGFDIVTAGDAALVVEFADRIDAAVNARVLAVARAIGAAGIVGVRDVVPTFRSVAVYFDPVRTSVETLRDALGREAANRAPAPAAGTPIRIPVHYGGIFGPDLAEVGALSGMTEEEVVAVHAGATYRVFMLGFVPGFAYLGIVDSRIAAPRRATPRLRVQAGAVGIAGAQTGVYPSETPGGWQIIGRTPVRPFDVQRADPFLLKPGDLVQFYPIDASEFERTVHLPQPHRREPSVTQSPGTSCLRVIKPGLLTTVQDRGHWGWQALGVPVAGPMDECSHRVANALVGNDAGAATLEITLVGPELEFSDERMVAVAGAEFALTVDRRAAPNHAAFVVAAGARLRFGEPRRGSRGYLAVSGGIAVAQTLGSRATHVVSRMGGLDGRPLLEGDRVPLGDQASRQRRGASRSGGPRAVKVPQRSDPNGAPARVRVLPGPQVHLFADDALDMLQSAPYAINVDSDRMGFRLGGPRLGHRRGADIVSDATPLATIQVPASGQPVLLMADRPTTGGYAKIATVITADVCVAGQLVPGDRIAFEVCTMRDAVRALVAQERALLAIESLSDA